MAYRRSLREIPLDQEPHASVIAALLPDPDESPFVGDVDWSSATDAQLLHVRICPACAEVLGKIGSSSLKADISTGVTR
jgi:hypothetical protein